MASSSQVTAKLSPEVSEFTAQMEFCLESIIDYAIYRAKFEENNK
jgi:hypothetical protein